MSWDEAFRPAEEKYATFVEAETWGYPKPHIKYNVSFLIAQTEYGETVTIRAEHPDDCGNPFFYEDLTDWLCNMKLEEGQIYSWKGYYWKYKNGNYRFTGKLNLAKVDI
jgi:hypothetical protein